MVHTSRIAILAAFAATLAGCQGLPWGNRSAARTDAPRAKDGRIIAQQHLEEGRLRLKEGNISQAVALFQLARSDASVAAEATNGLAVAYAKLGRPDLAERYFRTAILMEPGDTRYVANLLRLQGQVMQARRQATVNRLARADAATAGKAASAAALAVRETRREFRIQTMQPAAAPTMTVAYRNPPVEAEPQAPAPDPAPAEVDLAAAEKPRSFEVTFGPWLNK